MAVDIIFVDKSDFNAIILVVTITSLLGRVNEAMLGTSVEGGVVLLCV